MKCGVLLLTCSLSLSGADAEVSLPRAPDGWHEPGAEFFRDHPDLNEERDVVEAVSRDLGTEGFSAADSRHAREVLATRTRELLSRRTSQEWQKRAIRLYPDLGIAGSEFNALFLRYFRELQESTPGFAQEPSWPMLLAQRCADELRAGKHSARSVPSSRTSSAALAGKTEPPAGAVPPPQPTSPELTVPSSTPPMARRATAGLGVFLAGAALAVMLFFPGLLLWRWSHARSRTHVPGEGRAESPWHRALKPAAVIYGVAALVAIVQALPQNADLNLVNRLFITLCVSTVFGGCVGLVGYLFALLYCALHPRAGQPLRVSVDRG